MYHPLVETRPLRALALARRARKRRRDRGAGSLHRSLSWVAVLALLASTGAARSIADEGSREAMQGLDEQVQEIKSEVLGIAAELSRLEERLLYPSNTQLSVFVSLAEGGSFRLDSVQVQIDGAPVAHHIYSSKELEALQKGGVQRIYTGNVPVGEHRIEVSVAGKLAGGKDFAGSESFAFRKDVEPKLVGISLAAQDSGAARIELGGF